MFLKINFYIFIFKVKFRYRGVRGQKWSGKGEENRGGEEYDDEGSIVLYIITMVLKW